MLVATYLLTGASLAMTLIAVLTTRRNVRVMRAAAEQRRAADAALAVHESSSEKIRTFSGSRTVQTSPVSAVSVQGHPR